MESLRDQLPKLNLVCAKDAAITSMSHISITKEKVEASNGCVVVTHNTDELFGTALHSLFSDNENTENGREKRFYIPAEDWKALTGSFTRLELIGKYLMVHGKKGAPKACRLLPESEVGYYPCLGLILKDVLANRGFEVGSMRLKAKYIDMLAQSMSSNKELVLTFESTGYDKIVLVTPFNNDTEPYEVTGLILPVADK